MKKIISLSCVTLDSESSKPCYWTITPTHKLGQLLNLESSSEVVQLDRYAKRSTSRRQPVKAATNQHKQQPLLYSAVICPALFCSALLRSVLLYYVLLSSAQLCSAPSCIATLWPVLLITWYHIISYYGILYNSIPQYMTISYQPSLYIIPSTIHHLVLQPRVIFLYYSII